MQTIRQLADWIRARNSFAVVGHVSPDGDAIGSALALRDALEMLGKRAFIASTDAPPDMYRFLPGPDAIVRPEEAPFQPECVLYEDVASFDRAGDRGAFSDIPDRAVLDHHATNTGFGSVNVIRGDAAATGEMVLELLETLGVPLTSAIARSLYVAIATDTGNFSFANVTGGTVRAFARLIETGFDMPETNRRLFKLRTLARTRLLGAALNGLRLCMDERIAYTVVTRDMFERCGADRADTEGIVSMLTEIAGVRVAMLAEERGEGCTKLSLRSIGDADVSGVAGSFGGGGHKNAAGMTIVDCSLERAVEIALEALRRLIA